MSDAPERIWADANRYWSSVGWRQSNEFVGDVEYVRADIVQELTAERDRLREALTMIDAIDPEHHIDGCAQAVVRGLVLRMGETARTVLKGESHD